jgi:predicted TIM-barrel fold metal-dependent hydrolase
MIDVHAFCDPQQGLSVRDAAHAAGVRQIVVSPPAVVGNPQKSAALYAVQRHMLRSPVLAPVAGALAATFYGTDGRVRPIWRRVGSGGHGYGKVERPDNDGVAAVIAGQAQVWRWHWLGPEPIDAARLEQAVEDPRVAGLKLHAHWYGLEAVTWDVTARAARAHDLPVYIHMSYAGLDWLVDAWHRQPTRVILACGGFPHFDRVWRRIRALEHIAVDLASDHINAAGIRAAVQQLGAGRCLFASDAPYTFALTDPVAAYRQRVEAVRGMFPDPATRAQIFAGSAVTWIPRLMRRAPELVTAGPGDD